MSNVLKENYKKLVDALAPYFGGASDFDDLNNRPQESDVIDIEDLDLPMPAKPTEYPILFDETGTEYQAGWYKRANDGKVKPIYRKDANGTFSSTSSETKLLEFSNEYEIKKWYGYAEVNSDHRILEFGKLTNSVNNTENGLCIGLYFENCKAYIRSDKTYSNCNYWLSIEYTKTTDSWKEV